MSSSADELPGHPYGLHRVLEPPSTLPQAAERLDTDFSRAFDDELLIDVDVLNVDAASFRQLSGEAGGDPERVAKAVLATVAARGKQHNRVTGSGGMLIGRVARVGSRVAGRVLPGERIASLVSLTLTPLRLDAITQVHMGRAQIDVRGQAVLFASAPFARLPSELPERVALAALDVCGAPAQVARLAQPGQRVLILGAGGKSGLLCAAAARGVVGPDGLVVGSESSAAARADLAQLAVCDSVLDVDARDALALRVAAHGASEGHDYDLVVSCVNVEGVEPGAILCTRARGKALFFAMNTSFARAALFAEGVGKDVDLLIGNGFVGGHADLCLGLIQGVPALRAIFGARYGA